MKKPPLVVDTNLLLLYIVGAVDQSQIGQHKRLTAYSLDDFDLLTNYIDGRDLVSIPNILTETSNLMGQGLHGKTLAKARLGLKLITEQLQEIFVPSKTATQVNEFHWLGLTDCAIVSINQVEVELLTDDLNLYGVAIGKEMIAQNFNHLRDPYLS